MSVYIVRTFTSASLEALLRVVYISRSEKRMITQYKEICLICGKPASEIHHLVYGRGLRELALEDGLEAPLCGSCHKDIHYSGVAGTMSKIIGQLQWESEHEEGREGFRKRYGRSYL